MPLPYLPKPQPLSLSDAPKSMMETGPKNPTTVGRMLAVGALLLLSHASGIAQENSAPPRPVAPAPAATLVAPEVRGTDTVGPIKLRNESIDQVLNLLERWTGRTLLRPSALPAGAYTLTLDEPVSREEAILALETLLNLNGVAVTPLGTRFLKVTALNLARTESPTFIEGPAKDLPPSGQIASKLFSPKFLRVAEFLPQISGLLNPGLGAAPVIFEKSNSALVTDSISNLQRIEALLERLDRPFLENNATKFYSLHSAKASDVVNQLRTLLGGPLQMQLGAATSYQADDRTNQVILISDVRQQPFFDDLVAKLDVQADPNTRNEVIFLKNATAKDIATLLSQLVQGRNSASKAAGETGRPNVVTPTPNAAPNAPAAAALAALPGIESSQQFSELLTILPEERSNALIVSGTNDDIRLIRALVEKIDVLLSQVRIEVVIAEVTLNDETTSGITTLGLNVRANKLVGFSGSGAGTTVSNGTATNSSTGSTDLAADIGLTTTPRKNFTTILSQPVITTSHNKEGHIFVGEERPVISSFLSDVGGTSTGVGTTGFGRTTLSEKEIGVDLKVKPLIGNDGSVQLEIMQEVSDVLGEVTIDGNSQPRVGKRQTQSFISVRDGEIIVLGGLQRVARGKTTNRLGPVPIVGDLLGKRTRSDDRTDLLFFLRPHVLTNTSADNAEALQRIDAGPQRDLVRAALGSEPAAPPSRP